MYIKTTCILDMSFRSESDLKIILIDLTKSWIIKMSWNIYYLLHHYDHEYETFFYLIHIWIRFKDLIQKLHSDMNETWKLLLQIWSVIQIWMRPESYP